MRQIYKILFGCFFAFTHVDAQPALKIGAGTVLKQQGNVHLVISNADLTVNGSLVQGSSTANLRMSGSSNRSINGSNPLTLHNLTIDKGSGYQLVLGNSLTVNTSVDFVSGLLNLNGNNILLQSGGLLLSESETSHVMSTGGGYIQSEVDLNAPSSINPGNLGAVISSSANMGNTVIRRGHTAQLAGSSEGIKRYYDILPSNNLNLNATLRFYYLDSELNGVSKSNAELGRSTDQVNWINETVGVTYGVSQNYIEKTGISSFSRWSIFGEGVLPVELISFEGRIDDAGMPVLLWSTTAETNFSHFEIESGVDGRHFETLGRIEGKGGQLVNADYVYDDKRKLTQTRYYRLKMIDLDQTFHYSNLISLSSKGKSSIHYYPNPVQDILTLESQEEIATVEIFDTRGVLLKKYVSSGDSVSEVSMGLLPAGMYLIKINSGLVIKVIRQ